MNMLSPLEALLLFLFQTLEDTESKIEGRTKLQKIIYLSSRADNIFNFHFTGYLYGPYSKELQKTVSEMLAFNLISEEEEGFNHNTKYNYMLTTEGIKQAKNIWGKIDHESKKRIEKLAFLGKEQNSYRLKDILNKAYEIAEGEGIL